MLNRSTRVPNGLKRHWLRSNAVEVGVDTCIILQLVPKIMDGAERCVGFGHLLLTTQECILCNCTCIVGAL